MWNHVKCSPLASIVPGLFTSLLVAWILLKSREQQHHLCWGLEKVLLFCLAPPFPTLSVLDRSPPSFGYREQLLSPPWGHFPTSIGYPLSYMIHWGADLHISSRRLHFQLETTCIFNSERDPMRRKNTFFFPLETQQHLISPPVLSLLRWGLQSEQLCLRAQHCPLEDLGVLY